LKAYSQGIWDARYFWIHLALADLRARWRRSFIGAFWSILQPLGLTLLLAVVFSKLFHSDVMSYVPYILSGIITWDFISSSLTGGSLAFVQADAYIKQCKHPLAIYTLRLMISNLAVLMMASTVLWVWSGLVFPQHINVTWLAILSFFPLLLLMTWPLANLLAYFGARFRDLPHAMGLILQACWFISPVYFQTDLFRNGGLNGLVDYNPIYHLLQIVRAPLLSGEWPTSQNYEFCIGTALICTFLAILVGRKQESRIIFYI